MASYTLLDQAEEDDLHKSRLLNVEERPYKRILKRLTDKENLIYTGPKGPHSPDPNPKPEEEYYDTLTSEEKEIYDLEKRQKWREDVLFDFDAFESSIIRIQFLLASNERERERYAAEKLKIEATAQAVRDNTASLHLQLQSAQETLALRKEYDVLATKILSKPNLQSRDAQHANLAKLHAEIAESKRESEEYAATWGERRMQFGRIIEEGMELRRQIRDEKEEVERREGMEGEGDRDEEGSSSLVGTPMSDRGLGMPMRGSSPETRLGVRGGDLNVEKEREDRDRSPLWRVEGADTTNEKRHEQEDEEMAEDGELASELEGVTTAPVDGLVAYDGRQGQEKVTGAKLGDQMDTS